MMKFFIMDRQSGTMQQRMIKSKFISRWCETTKISKNATKCKLSAK